MSDYINLFFKHTDYAEARSRENYLEPWVSIAFETDKIYGFTAGNASAYYDAGTISCLPVANEKYLNDGSYDPTQYLVSNMHEEHTVIGAGTGIITTDDNKNFSLYRVYTLPNGEMRTVYRYNFSNAGGTQYIDAVLPRYDGLYVRVNSTVIYFNRSDEQVVFCSTEIYPPDLKEHDYVLTTVPFLGTGTEDFVETVAYEPGVQLKYNKTSEEINKEIPLTFEITSDGVIYWMSDVYNTATSAYNATYIEYSKNDADWTTIASSPWYDSYISVTSGDTVRFRGNNAHYGSYDGTYIADGRFETTCSFKLAGNMMSMISSTGFTNLYDFSETFTFGYMFSKCSGLTDASNLVLPATGLTNQCYHYMFMNCTNLVTPPKILPAETISSYYCYQSMFQGCTSLTTAPALPATALTSYCYASMFYGCTSLTKAPKLPATTLAYGCYHNMFGNCTALTIAPELPATTLADSCYQSMFHNCTNLRVAPKLPAMDLSPYCYRFMFNNCTSLTTAPALPATTLVSSCYTSMFQGCTSLTTAPELPATTLKNYCYYAMFSGCTNLNYIKCLATNISASNCTTNWVRSVSATGTFVKDPNMSSWTTGVNSIPTGWTVIDSGKEQYYYNYLTFNVISAGTIRWKTQDTAYTTTISYSKNSGSTWTTITSNTGNSAPSISVSAGDKVIFKGDNPAYSSGDSRFNTFSGSTAKFEVEGNIMSLINSTGFATATTLQSACTFSGLFYGCTGLTSAENLVLPATTLLDSCYRYMFSGCESLTMAPELPATTMAESCYRYMFTNCTSLTTAPTLPATTLANYCYSSMFAGCTSLTTAPSLPVTTLKTYCYTGMFTNCTSLTTAPTLPATTLTTSCYQSMFYGCTGLTTAPELPATTLKNYCYYQMFSGCTSLNYIKCLATNISASNSHNNWVDGVASSGTFIKASSISESTWGSGANGIPTGWTVQSV